MNPRTMFVSVLVASFVVFHAKAQEDQLPPDVSNLLGKLEQWEKEQNLAHQRRIQEKRDAVAEALKESLEAVTRSGDLDLALKIRKEISKLQEPTKSSLKGLVDSGEAEKMSNERDPRLSSKEVEAIAENFEGKWRWDGQGRFNAKDGKVYFGREVWTYEIERDGYISIEDTDGRVAKFKLSADFNSISGTDFDGNEVTTTRIPEDASR